MRTTRLAAAVAAGFIATSVASARLEQIGERLPPYIVREQMIPMRDGVKLFTRIFVPRDQRDPLPILMQRTPYGVGGADERFDTSLKTLADDGYIFVFQDIRGKFRSEGQFVMQRPARAPEDTTAMDEGTDTYDTIDWLLKNVPHNNGRSACSACRISAGRRSWAPSNRTPRSKPSPPRPRPRTCGWATTSTTTARFA